MLAKSHIQLLSRTHGTNKTYLSYSFAWIKIHNRTENVYVTKLVVLVTRILKHLGLYFSDFLRISRYFQSSAEKQMRKD